jgi:hypothetical protein
MGSAKKRRAFKFPRDLGACVRLLASVMARAERAAAAAAPLAEEEAALREHLLATFKKSQLDGTRGAGISLAVQRTAVPTLKDWKKFLRYCLRAGNDDLLQRSVNTPAWRERMDAKRAVPGVEPFNRVSLRVTRERK